MASIMPSTPPACRRLIHGVGPLAIMPAELADLNEYPQPERNRHDSVSVALEKVIQAHDKQSSSSAYNMLLYAVGNNHAGTYFPVVLAVIPVLETILCDGKPWSQHTVLEALIDLYSSFQPDPAYATFHEVSLSAALRDRISALKPHLVSLATGNPITDKSAQDLLNCLDEQSY